jgi:hypothetical protein
MEKEIERLLPRFRYGDIAPRGKSGREVMRGFGYEFYRIVPMDVNLNSEVWNNLIRPGVIPPVQETVSQF